MTARRRAGLSLALGLVAFGVPALAWAYIIVTELRNPQAFSDQGGMMISFILFPLAMLGALVFGILALILGAGGPAGPPGSNGPGRWVGAGLSLVGLLLAIGTCIGPQMLAAALR